MIKTNISSKKQISIVVFFAIFSDMLLFGLAGPVLPTYMDMLGATQIQTGMLFTIYALALLISAPIFGLISDKIGNRKAPMIWAVIGMLLACILFIFAKNYYLLLVGRAIQGFTGGIMWTVGLALIADTYSDEKNRAKAMGFALSGQALGTLLGPTLGGWLYQIGGYTLPFIFALGITIIDAILRLSIKETTKTNNDKILLPFTMLKSKELILVSCIVIVGAMVAPIMYSTLTLHMKKTLNVGLGIIGTIFMIPSITYALISPIIGSITTKIGYFKTMFIGIGLMCITFPMLTIPTTIVFQILTVALIGISMGTVLVPAVSYITTLANKKNYTHGVSYSIYNTAYSAGMFIGPTIGSVAVYYLGVKLCYLIIGIVLFTFLLTIILIKKNFEKHTTN